MYKCISKAFTLAEGATHVDNLNNVRRIAFTLAEVLITLGIIGVVAALTIPGVIDKYQKQETVSRLKKAYSIMQNAIKMSELENGEVSSWTLISSPSVENNEAFVKKYFLPYLNVPKYCGYVNDSLKSNSCYPAVNLPQTEYAYYMYGNYDQIISIAFYLNDGTLIKIAPATGQWANVIAYIYINLKPGDKSLATHFSHNAFVSVLFKDGRFTFFKLNPVTGVPDPDINDPARPNADFYARVMEDCKPGRYLSCGAMIQMSDWKIEDNYPW